MTVCDARPVFATRTRFPQAELVVNLPHRYLQAELRAGRTDDRTAICVLTHDPKFDIPLLKLALKPCRSQATSARWAPGAPTRTGWRSSPIRASLPADLSWLSSPIGLDLGARTPQGSALSIMAEIVALLTAAAGPASPAPASHPSRAAEYPATAPPGHWSRSSPLARSPHSTPV